MREYLHILCSNEERYINERVLLEVYNGVTVLGINMATGGRGQESCEVLDGLTIRALCDSVHDLLVSVGVSEETIRLVPYKPLQFKDVPEDDPFIVALKAWVHQHEQNIKLVMQPQEMMHKIFHMCRLAVNKCVPFPSCAMSTLPFVRTCCTFDRKCNTKCSIAGTS